MEKEKDIKYVPNIETRLRHNILKMPDCIRKASGIVIYGRRIKSIVFTTDLAIIRNCDADAVLAVERRRVCARLRLQKTLSRKAQWVWC